MKNSFWEWEMLKMAFQVYFLGKVYVLNNKNKVIHHWTCKWVDNISNPHRLTEKEAKELLNYYPNMYRVAECCKDKIRL